MTQTKLARRTSLTVAVAKTCLIVWLAFSLGTCFAGSPDTISPAEELKTFQVPDGFEVSLYASEELGILNPMQMRWDAQGRLFVISTLAYPQLRPGEVPNDKIIMLEDTDSNGVADKSTVFAEGLNIPTGLEPGHGGLYIGEQTDLVFLKDTDGDGQADQRKVVLSGFGVGDTHQAINSFVWSPGGELYFDQGDGIESRVETPWGLSGLYQAGVMRLRPKRLQLDPFLDDFMGPGNPWGIAFDDWGQTFVVDGAGGITFLSPAMMPVRHRRRLRTIGKPGGYCGVDVLGSRHLPQDFQGDFVISDFKKNRIGRFSAKPQGAGFEVHWKDPILVSNHRNFRPVDVRIGPDGAIYVCDWYNSIICHQDDPFRHPDRDLAHGRIWRISYAGKEPISPPRLNQLATGELLNQLSSPERWTRYQAKAVLANRERAEVARAFTDFWQKQTALSQTDPSEHLLLELIGVLESVETPHRDMLEQLLAAQDHRARAYAARVVGRWHDRLDAPLELLRPLSMDPHPQVRMECVVASAHIPDAQSAEVVAAVADRDIDYDIDYAFGQALHHLAKYWVPAFKRGELRFGDKPNRLAAVLQSYESKQLLAAIRDLAKNPDDDARITGLKMLARVGDDNDLRQVLLQTKHSAQTVLLLRELVASQRTLDTADQSDTNQIKELIHNADIETQVAAIQLAAKWRVQKLHESIAPLAMSSPQVPTRLAAIQYLGNVGSLKSADLLQGLAKSESPEVATEATLAWLKLDQDSATTIVAAKLASAELNDEMAAKLLKGLAAKADGLKRLATTLAETNISPTTAQRILDVLNSTASSEATLVELLFQRAKLSNQLPEFSEQNIAKVVAQMHRGDPVRGKQLFRSKRANCLSCHQVQGEGGTIGPDLSTAGTTLPKTRLVQEVFWPRKQVKEGYNLNQIVTTEGIVLQGYVRKSRSKDRILLLPIDSTDRQPDLIEIHKDDIEESKDVGSAMPENIVATFNEQERLDLLSFLSELGRDSKAKQKTP